MKRILLVKTSSMGDVVHNLTTVSDIRRCLPDVEIDWLVEKSFAAIPSMHPGVRQVIPVEVRRWRKNLFSPATWQQVRTIKQTLRDRSYDVVIDTQGLLKSAIIARWAARPVSGYDRDSIREPLASVFYKNKYQVSRQQHAVDRNRQLVGAVLGYDSGSLPMQYGISAAPGSQKIPGLGGEYVVCLHGTSRDSKLWPESSWQQLITAISASGAQPVLVWGSERERLRSERLARSASNSVIVPRLDLQQLASLLAESKGVIGVDTGPVHLAVALGCKTVALYTDTEPGMTGVAPVRKSDSINLGGAGQSPSSDQVMDAARRLGIV